MNDFDFTKDSIVTESKSREMWLDFETWLYKNHGKTLPDLSWNDYIQYSKQYTISQYEEKNA